MHGFVEGTRRFAGRANIEVRGRAFVTLGGPACTSMAVWRSSMPSNACWRVLFRYAFGRVPLLNDKRPNEERTPSPY